MNQHHAIITFNNLHDLNDYLDGIRHSADGTDWDNEFLAVPPTSSTSSPTKPWKQ